MKTNIGLKSLMCGALAAVALTSCYEDKGNYDYRELVPVTIDAKTEGLRDTYVIGRGEKLAINPDVYYNGRKVETEKDAPLDYIWTLYDQHTGIGVDYKVDTLATTKALDVNINRAGGSYYVQLTVRKHEDGIETYYRANCTVEETITGGWMALYERSDRPGTSDVALFVNPYVKKNVTDSREFINLYSSTNGAPLDGAPVRVIHDALPMPNGSVALVTDKDFVTVTQQDFLKFQSFDDKFYTKQAKGKISYFGMGSRAMCKWVMIMDNEVRILDGTPGAGAGTSCFALPKKNVDVGTFADWGTYCPNVADVVVYDQTNGAFYYTQKEGRDWYSFAAQSGAFNINDTKGAKLLYGDWGMGWLDVMLFKRDNGYFVGEANFGVAPTMVNIGQTWTDVSSSPDLANVSAWAVNGTGKYAFYGAGNKVYNLAYLTGRPAEAIWTAPSADEVVTCIATQKYYFQSLYMAMIPNKDALVHIATYNQKTGEGKVYQYQINPAAGTILPDTDHYEYKVPGKVKDMGWKYAMDR